MYIFNHILIILFLSILIGCGGGNANGDEEPESFIKEPQAPQNVQLGGQLYGLKGSIVIENTFSIDLIEMPGNGGFSWIVKEGSSYEIVIHTHPENQTCIVENGAGSVFKDRVKDIIITCEDNPVMLDDVSGEGVQISDNPVMLDDVSGEGVQISDNPEDQLTDDFVLLDTTDAGSLYIFDRDTEELINQLTGASPGDEIGSGGVIPLVNGNLVIVSPSWDYNPSDPTYNSGAVTVVDETGRAVVDADSRVTEYNSVHAISTMDRLSYHPTQKILLLPDNQFLIISSVWDNKGDPSDMVNVGAVTPVSGVTGLLVDGTLEVTRYNSVVGRHENDGDQLTVVYNEVKDTITIHFTDGMFITSRDDLFRDRS